MRPNFDAEWRANALSGDAAAITSLAQAAIGPLYDFCLYRVGRNSHLCEEVVQDTLLIAIGRLEHYDPGRAGNNIFPWLSGLARNEIQRVLAREKPLLSLEMLWAKMDQDLLTVCRRLEAEPFAEEILRRDETRELVNVTMSQLPPHYREALEAKYVSGKSVRDLADRWQVTEKAAESQLTRARKLFRATFLALVRNLEPELP